MKPIMISLLLSIVAVSCSVVSKDIRQQAIEPPSFRDMVDRVDQYKNKVVILGAHILEVKNKTDGSSIKALQVPLMMGDKPGAKDDSKGRLTIVTTSFIEPEIYTKGRKITVAGKILAATQAPDAPPLPHLTIEAQELHLWPEYQSPRYRYPYDDPFWYWNDPWYGWHYPFFFRGHIYHHHYLRHHHRRR